MQPGQRVAPCAEYVREQCRFQGYLVEILSAGLMITVRDELPLFGAQIGDGRSLQNPPCAERPQGKDKPQSQGDRLGGRTP